MKGGRFGNWDNDDDPMGGIGLTALMDDDCFDWDVSPEVPTR
ncbi:hypothetical protein [Thermococcus sp.]|nr:hypothetical protein [Thermococcus sp.]